MDSTLRQVNLLDAHHQINKAPSANRQRTEQKERRQTRQTDTTTGIKLTRCQTAPWRKMGSKLSRPHGNTGALFNTGVEDSETRSAGTDETAEETPVFDANTLCLLLHATLIAEAAEGYLDLQPEQQSSESGAKKTPLQRLCQLKVGLLCLGCGYCLTSDAMQRVSSQVLRAIDSASASNGLWKSALELQFLPALVPPLVLYGGTYQDVAHSMLGWRKLQEQHRAESLGDSFDCDMCEPEWALLPLRPAAEDYRPILDASEITALCKAADTLLSLLRTCAVLQGAACKCALNSLPPPPPPPPHPSSLHSFLIAAYSWPLTSRRSKAQPPPNVLPPKFGLRHFLNQIRPRELHHQSAVRRGLLVSCFSVSILKRSNFPHHLYRSLAFVRK